MSTLPNSARDIDLLRWVAAHENEAFDPNMVVTATHTTDWQWQAVNDRMEGLRGQGLIHKEKQDPTGSTYWTMLPKGQNYLRVLEHAEKTVEQETSNDASSISASRILPPTIAKSFGATRIGLNRTTTLTFAVSNPNPKATLTGVGFTDTLPRGLVVASPNGLIGEFGGGTLTAMDGSNNISLSGASLAPGALCQFTVNVTGTSPGGMINTTGPVFASEGGTGNTASAPIGVLEAPAEPTVPTPLSSSDWLSQAAIERFSEKVRSVLDRSDQIRSIRKRPAVSTLHLLMAFSEQPDGQLANLLKQAGVDINSLIPPTADIPEEGAEDVLSRGAWTFPLITKDVRNALVRARDKADYEDSTVIDDGHLLFGVLSENKGDNLVIRELNKRGVTAGKVKLPTIYEGGPSTHVARDRWTIHDSLGYFPYAYAIYRFLTDKNTASPLAISIQAPWGGGKTSMMRMIQGQLDPDSLQKVDITASISENATVKDVQAELKKLSEGKATPIESGAAGSFQVPPIGGEGEHRATVWFNAWKYESTAQIWAGLADSIVHQIADRLSPVDRELFWLRLRLRRVDVAKIRGRIHDQVLGRFWERLPAMLWAYIIGPVISICVAIAGKFLQSKALESFGWIGTALASGLAAFIASKQWTSTVSEVGGQPARLSLGELVEAPDYEANLGFVHHVASDLKRVFELIPKKHRPIVIFIDDLDRCSPNKVSDVIEAVNLFLAGEFPDCIFVLGIDDEMVAAALDKAHGDVISKLPSYAKPMSIGWRFMDKFVQLPFIIPPPVPDELKKYANSLFSEGDAGVAEIAIETRNKMAQVIEKADTNAKPQQIAQKVAKEQSLSPQQQKVIEEEAVVIQQMDSNIRAFSDEEKKMRNFLTTIAADFSANPRDIKRFVNVFRFYYFLRAAREARGELVPSLKQLSRWILFSLKWPEGVRFLWRTQLSSYEPRHPQLEALEKAGKECSDLEDWNKGAAAVVGLKPEEKAWIFNEEVMRFFKNESRLPEEERLSASCGKGLW